MELQLADRGRLQEQHNKQGVFESVPRAEQAVSCLRHSSVGEATILADTEENVWRYRHKL